MSLHQNNLFLVFGFTLTTCNWDRYASDNNFPGTRRGSRKKPIAGTSPTGRLSTVALCRGVEKNGMVGARHGLDMASVNQTRPHCVNQMWKTRSKPLAARHGRGTAWARHAMCESALMVLTTAVCGHQQCLGTEHSSAILCLPLVFSYKTIYFYASCGLQNGHMLVICSCALSSSRSLS